MTVSWNDFLSRENMWAIIGYVWIYLNTSSDKKKTKDLNDW